MRDPYKILGLSRQAKPDDIKKTFRKLAKQYHPDHNRDNPKAKERFAEINQAYEILGDKDKRAQFDRGEIDAEGKQNFHAYSGRRADPFADFASAFGQSAEAGGRAQFRPAGFEVDDLFFRDLFSRHKAGANAPGQQRGGDQTATISISLEQAIGAEKVEAIFPNGKKLKIKLPSFVEDGQVIRLKGQGEAGKNGKNGDALVTISFKSHPRFRLEGRALHLDLPVPLKSTVLGGKQEIETLDGRVMVTIPSWSSSDRVLRLRGKGLPEKSGNRADLYVHIRIMLPPERDHELEDYLRGRY